MKKKKFYENIKKINKNFIEILKKKKNFFKFKKETFNNLKKIGIINLKDENQKYTSTNKIIDYYFNINENNEKIKFNLKKIKININANHIILINGKFNKKNSIIEYNKKLLILELNKAYKLNKKLFEKYFTRQTNLLPNIFIILNTILFKNGIFIKVENDTEIKKPIILYYLFNNIKEKITYYPRNLILIGENSKTTIINYYYNLKKKNFFLNLVSEIILLNNSKINHYKIQNKIDNLFQIETNQFYQSKNSYLKTYVFTLNGNIIKNNLIITLDSENCKTKMYGLCLANLNQNVDNQTTVNHVKPNSISKELYKNILNDKANVAFNGKIYVKKNAKKTNAFQLNKNIILSNEATVKTKPQLEIITDDVKCSHGATIEKINQKQLFYLKSRGIEEKKSKKILIKAFIEEIIEKIKKKMMK